MMLDNKLTTKALNSFKVEGARGFEDLCKMAELMGYKDTGRFAINQLQLRNGAFVSSLIRFFEDNPGLIETIHEWVRQNYQDDLADNDTMDYGKDEE